METLIAYMTTHGCTERIAQQIAGQMSGKVELCNLKTHPSPDLSVYKRVIVGGSIHAGQIQKQVKEFCRQSAAQLREKELGLFVSCLYEGEVARQQLQVAFPPELLLHAKCTARLGGAFDFEKMNFWERWMVKKVARIQGSASLVDQEAVDRFARKMDRSCSPFLFLI